MSQNRELALSHGQPIITELGAGHDIDLDLEMADQSNNLPNPYQLQPRNATQVNIGQLHLSNSNVHPQIADIHHKGRGLAKNMDNLNRDMKGRTDKLQRHVKKVESDSETLKARAHRDSQKISSLREMINKNASALLSFQQQTTSNGAKLSRRLKTSHDTLQKQVTQIIDGNKQTLSQIQATEESILKIHHNQDSTAKALENLVAHQKSVFAKFASSLDHLSEKIEDKDDLAFLDDSPLPTNAGPSSQHTAPPPNPQDQPSKDSTSGNSHLRHSSPPPSHNHSFHTHNSESDTDSDNSVDDPYCDRFGRFTNPTKLTTDIRDDNKIRAICSYPILSLPTITKHITHKSIIHGHYALKYHPGEVDFVKESLKYSRGSLKKRDTVLPTDLKKLRKRYKEPSKNPPKVKDAKAAFNLRRYGVRHVLNGVSVFQAILCALSRGTQPSKELLAVGLHAIQETHLGVENIQASDNSPFEVSLAHSMQPSKIVWNSRSQERRGLLVSGNPSQNFASPSLPFSTPQTQNNQHQNQNKRNRRKNRGNGGHNNNNNHNNNQNNQGNQQNQENSHSQSHSFQGSGFANRANNSQNGQGSGHNNHNNHNRGRGGRNNNRGNNNNNTRNNQGGNNYRGR